MNENLDQDAVKRMLDHSLSQLDQTIVAGLHQARQNALHDAAAARKLAPLIVWFGAHGHHSSLTRHHSMAMWLAAALLAISLIGSAGYFWQQSYQSSDELDIAILTDDLPTNYYVD